MSHKFTLPGVSYLVMPTPDGCLTRFIDAGAELKTTPIMNDLRDGSGMVLDSTYFGETMRLSGNFTTAPQVSNDALRLAFAIIQGDHAASLLLADCILEKYGGEKSHIGKAVQKAAADAVAAERARCTAIVNYFEVDDYFSDTLTAIHIGKPVQEALAGL